MPCDKGRLEDNFCTFQDILSESEYISVGNDAMYTISGGDCNTDLNRSTSPQTQELLTFCDTEKMVSGCLLPVSTVLHTVLGQLPPGQLPPDNCPRTTPT